MNIKKHLRRTPWHIYTALVALVLWVWIIGFYVGYQATGQSVEPEPVEAAPAHPVAVLTATPAVEDKPYIEDKPCEEDKPELLALGEFKITHYCACAKCCGKWADGFTATGTEATEGRTIAVDPDVIPYGTEVLVRYQDGTEAVYIAEDCGGAIQGNRIDVFMDSHEAALVEGIKAAQVFVKEART